MKIIDKKEMIAAQTEVKEEIDILQRVGKHPNIVSLVNSFEDDKEFFLVTELCSGGDLFSRIIENGHFSEKQAISVCKQLGQALEHIHSKGITHRDLKPENILMEREHELRVKVCDFGLSKLRRSKMKTVCGTWAYCAPEVISNKEYTSAVDCWTLGVLMYVLLSGYHPFDVYGDTPEPELLKRIIEVTYDFDDPVWADVSEDAKNLIRALLVDDPETRMTAAQYLKSAWVNSEGRERHNSIVMAKLKGMNQAMSRRDLNAPSGKKDLGMNPLGK